METWTPERLKKARENWEAGNQKPAAQTTKAPETKASPKETSGEWTPERIKKARESWETGTPARATAASGMTTAGSLGGQVLAQMMGSTGSARSTNPKLQLAVPSSGTQSERNGTRGGTAQPEWLGKAGSSTPAAQVRGTVKPTETKRQLYAATGGAMQLQSGYGAVNSAPNADALKQTIAAGDGKRVDWYARTAQEAKEDFAKNSEPDRFDELNQWMDADPKHRELVNLIRGGTGEQQPYVQRGNAMQAQDGTGAMASAPTAQSTGKRDYTDAELQAKGYTQTEINEAKAYIRDFDALPAWQRAVRRTSNTIGGIAEEFAAGGLQMGENAVQAVKNSSATKKNRDALKESLAGDARQEKLFKLVDTVDSNGSPKYSDAELIAKGYTQGEIDDMRSRYAATEVKDAVDPEKSVGYQLHKRSKDLTGAAMSGLSPLAQKALGIVSSAGENLVVASIDPAMVLPVLSLQGAGESMGQSVEKGDSAGKTLAGGVLKFGAGWAINSVGAADLAKTMGTDYAKDTLAGKLADVVRSVADNGPLAQQYPVIANAVSGGVDNAMQAFAETYADMAIDAALGDSEAAQNLFKKDTFLNAVESGLTGGASGALGGAVGTGLGKMNAALDAAAGGQQAQEESAQAASPHQSAAPKASPEGEALSPADMQAQQVKQFVDEAVADNNKTGRTENETAGLGNAKDVKYSIQVDADGKNFVQIDKDILEGVPQEQWKGVVKDAIKEMFPDGFERDGNHIDNTREGRNEFVRSKSTMWLQHHEGETYADKMRMAQNLDELVQTSGNAVNEAANHKNAESFNRGKINVRVGTNDYRVDVLTAIKNDGREVFYDVVGIEPEKIKAPTRTAEETSGSKSVGTDEDIRRSGAGNAESNDKSLPDASEEIAKVLQSPVNAVASPGDNVRNVVADPSATTDLSQSPMDAAESDPRHTSETLAASSSADATVTQQAGEVNRNEAKSSPADYADVELRADMANLDADSWTRAEQVQTAKDLAQHYRMSDAAVQTVADNMPVGIGADIYAPAAASLYRLGVNGEGESFADAVKMTGGGGALSGAVQQVMALGDTGRMALELAYTQGKGEAEHYREVKAAELGKRPGKEALRADAGTLYNHDGTVSKSKRADDALIALTAGANGVAAQRVVKGLANNAKGLIQSAAGAVFYSSEADTATVLHETLHEVNSWDAKGGQELIDTFEHYLVQQNGMETVQQLVESYLDRYEKAGQSLTYNQAMEEITADAMQSIFGSEESFRDFLRQQAAEAKMNAAALGKTNRVMAKIETLLKKVLTDIKSLLVKQPTNAAAKAAQTLTEQQLKDLRQLYFNHQADAGEAYRAALEANGGANKNAADIKDAATGEGKYSIDPDYAEKIDAWDKEGRSDDEVFILGSTGDTLQGLGARENDIYMNSDKINKILRDHPEMTLEEIKRIPEVLDDPTMILTSQNKGRSQQNTRLVMFGSVKAKDGKPVMCILDLQPVENKIMINDMQKLTSAYTKDTNPVQFVRNSDVLYTSENKKRTTALLRSLGFEMPSELQPCGSIGSIAYTERSVKLEGVKFTELEGAPGTRYQLDVDSEDVEAAKEAQLGEGREAGDTVEKIVKTVEGARVSDESLEGMVRKAVKASGSRADVKTLTSRMRALSDYLASGHADMAQAHGFVLDIAQQIMERSAKKNDELWKAYPELHEMSMSLAKGSKDYNEVLYKYGSWAEARKELAKHGVKLTLTKNGEVSRWDADFTELQGIGGGLLPAETPTSAADALEAMAAAHDAIRPTMESAYDSDWDAAKQEMAMELWGDYLGLPGIASAKNEALRAEFAAKREQMNTAARKEAMRLQAEANLAAARQRGTERQKMRKGYAEALNNAAKAQQDADARAQKARKKVAEAQARNAERLAKLRDSRDKDNTRRAIRKATSELTKMFEHPNEKKYVPEYLLDKVRPVLQLANEAIGNRETAQRLAQWAHRGEAGWTYQPMQDSKRAMNEAMHELRDGIKREIERSDRAQLAWENSGIQDAIDEWIADVNANREEEIKALQAKIEDAKQYTREDESPSWTAYVDGLNSRLAALKNGGMATLSSTELRGLRDIIDQTLHIVKIDNVVVGAQEDVMIDEFAEGANAELKDAKGISKKSGFFGKVSRALNSYKMNTMNIERMFERLGGYTHGGYLENIGKMLNDGQRKKTKILIEGSRFFDELTGPAHEKELYHYTHDLIDIGLRDDSGKARKITHDQLAELALQLQNRQGVHHILHGGITLENMEAKLSGDAELAKLDKATVRAGQLTVTDSEGNKLDAAALYRNEDAERRNLLEEVDKHLTDYDRAWMEAYKKANAQMSGYINETSMLLSGTKKATTENYIHINVDSDTNPEQNKGIRYDNSAANPSFLNHRVNSGKPVVLVGLVQQAMTNIENTAQYAGMAIPLRNAEKILNSMQGGKTLFRTIEDNWGTAARSYMNKALADLCEVKDSRQVGDGVFAKLRSYAAAAALNANVNVTLLQAASLPTSAAELGWGATGSAAVQFGKNLADPRNVLRFFGSDIDSSLTKIEKRMAEHGDELLAYRLRGTGTGEMASANAQKGFLGRSHDAARNSENKAVRGVTKAADKVISLWTGGITKMDEITVAACWQGSESYVKAHPEEFGAGAEVVNSPEYWAAVNEKFQQVVEHTQPNYTTMQRTGFQRSGNEMTKALMMFSTQRQQNAQILTSAFEDYAAQNAWVKAREKAYKEHPSAEAKDAIAEAQKAKGQAGQRVWRAVSSQVLQTTVIAALGVGVKFGLHRWQDLQDDNGDMTLWSAAADFGRQWIKSFGSNWTGVSEAMTAVDLVTSGFTSTRSTISMNGIEVLNDVVRKMAKVYQLEAKDTSEMTEKQLEAYNAQMKEAIVDMLGQFAAARGIPYANLKKQVQAVTGWMDTLAEHKETGEWNFDSLPASATGQYDRLYNAYMNGDSVEAKAAMEKLDAMVEAGSIQENKMYEQMKKRLQQYEPRVTEAAKETNADNWEKRKELVDQMTDEIQKTFGGEQSDAHDCVVKAVDALGNELLKSEKGYDKGSSIYAGLRDAVGGGSSESVQEEYDRLVEAGKKPSSVKNEITKAAKADYVDGSDYDREQLAEMLLALTDKDGNALYQQKNLDDWVKQAEKEAEKEAQKEGEFDRYDLLK